MAKPNIQNLRKRAAAFGLSITKSEESQKAKGRAAYFVHGPNVDLASYGEDYAYGLYAVSEIIALCERDAASVPLVTLWTTQPVEPEQVQTQPVEPQKRSCSIVISIAGRIVRMGDESDISVRSYTGADWQSVDVWERRAAELARHYSPFWRGETVA